jgi:hypothetical protein
LPALLFNLVGDVLSKMLAMAVGVGLIAGLLEEFRHVVVITMQYADDTILFSSCEDVCLTNLKVILMLFEQVSSMIINFHKSECILMNVEDEVGHQIAHLLNCPIGSFPLKYLGIPLHFDRLKRDDLQHVLDKIIRRAAGWRGRLLAYSSRLVLVRTYLSSILIYLLSFMKFPK